MSDFRDMQAKPMDPEAGSGSHTRGVAIAKEEAMQRLNVLSAQSEVNKAKIEEYQSKIKALDSRARDVVNRDNTWTIAAATLAGAAAGYSAGSGVIPVRVGADSPATWRDAEPSGAVAA